MRWFNPNKENVFFPLPLIVVHCVSSARRRDAPATSPPAPAALESVLEIDLLGDLVLEPRQIRIGLPDDSSS